MGKIIRLTNEIEEKLKILHSNPTKALKILLDNHYGFNEVQKKEVKLIVQDVLWKAKEGY